MSLPKIERNQKLIKARENGLSYRAIAREFHLASSRVFFIVKRELGKVDKSKS